MVCIHVIRAPNFCLSARLYPLSFPACLFLLSSLYSPSLIFLLSFLLHVSFLLYLRSPPFSLLSTPFPLPSTSPPLYSPRPLPRSSTPPPLYSLCSPSPFYFPSSLVSTPFPLSSRSNLSLLALPSHPGQGYSCPGGVQIRQLINCCPSINYQ